MHSNDTTEHVLRDLGQPKPLEDSPDPFPIEALPNDERMRLKDFALAVSISTQTPVDLVALGSIAVLGAAVRGRFDVRPMPDWREPVHSQVLLVMSSGGGKGPAFRRFTAPLYESDRLDTIEWEIAHGQWEADVRELQFDADKLRQKAKGIKATGNDKRSWLDAEKILDAKKTAEPIRRRIVASNITSEALEIRIFEQRGAMAVFQPEGGFLTNITGGYGDVLKLAPLLHGFSGEPFENDRKTTNEQWRVQRSCVAACLAIQPIVLETLGKNPGFRFQGASARFIFACPKPVSWPDLSPPRIPVNLEESWNSCILRISKGTVGTAYDPVAMQLSEDAISAFQSEREWWREGLNNGSFDGIDEWGRKYCGQLLRVAGSFHLMSCDSPHLEAISGENMLRAIAIGRYLIGHSKIAHGHLSGLGGPGDAIRLFKALMDLSKGWSEDRPIRRSDLHAKVRGQTVFAKAEALEGPLSHLEDRNWIRREREESGERGRPAESIFINSRAHTENTAKTPATNSPYFLNADGTRSAHVAHKGGTEHHREWVDFDDLSA